MIVSVGLFKKRFPFWLLLKLYFNGITVSLFIVLPLFSGVFCENETTLTNIVSVVSNLLIIAFFNLSYKFFNACFINASTLASGVSFNIFPIALSACFLAKPRTSSADNASSLFVLF